MLQSIMDVTGTGFTVLDRVYEDGNEPFESLGGSCGNVLISLAMLKRNVAPLIAIGRDRVGDQLVQEFKEAGAHTQYISRREDTLSPILAQTLNTAEGQHSFSFVCPETNQKYPQYQPINCDDAESAENLLDKCGVFFADRLSSGILDAMKTAFHGGAITFFEPSAIEDGALFEEALKYTSVLKFSSDRLNDQVKISDLASTTILLVTYGSDGLEVQAKSESKLWLKATPAKTVRDTCGSGDMVSVGLIDWIIENGSCDWTIQALSNGIRAGQRLAAANCSFSGARGLFGKYGADVARQVLSGGHVPELNQLDIFDKHYH